MSEQLAEGGVRQRAREPLLLASLGVALYFLPYLGRDELALFAVFLAFGLPMVVGALLRSATVLAVPVLVGVLLVLPLFLGGMGDINEIWTDENIDSLSGLGLVILVIVELFSAAIGIAVGHTLARWRHRP